MATKKISELTALTTPVGTEQLVVEEAGGTSKKITAEDLFAGKNVKAKFGAGDDLQIYHDGSHSYIKDAGTGQLRLLAGTNVQIWNADATNLAANFNGDTQTSLYYAGSSKLATTNTGIDISGTAEAHKVEIGNGSSGGTSEILFSDNVSARGKILYDHSSNPETLLLQTTGTTAISVDNSQNVSIPNGNLDVTGTATMDGLTVAGDTLSMSNTGNTSTISLTQKAGTQNSIATISANREDTTTSASRLLFSTNDGTSTKQRMRIANTGDISFYEDTGTTPKFFWDASAESLGIGVAPSYTFDVSAASAVAMVRTPDTTSPTLGLFVNAGSNGIGTISVDDGGHMTFDTGANGAGQAERMRIDSSGNVGIGNSAPLGKLTISNAAGTNAPSTVTAANTYLQLGSDDYGPSNNGKFMIGFGFTDATNTNSPAYIGYEEASTSGDTYGDLTFYTRSVTTDTAPTEAMRIDSSGNVLVGHSSFSFGGANDCVQIAGNEGRINFENDTTATAYVASFYNPNGLVGKISTSGSSTNYATSSDYRLKEDWQPMSGASDRLMQLNPVNFAWKADGSRVDGFLAHEAQEVVPEAVSGEKDAMTTEEYEVSPAVYEDVVIPAVDEVLDEDGIVITEAQEERTEQNLVSEAVMGEREVEDYQGIDQSKLVPLLTAALQEALARIEALENK